MSVEANREAQRAAYGEPLGETFGRLKQALGLNQAGLAKVLGISAPMLSQLISAQRVKIGNPAVLGRVQRLHELAEAVGAGKTPPEEVPALLEEIRSAQSNITRTTQLAPAAEDGAVVAGIRNLLRAVASGAELRAAAETLESDHPRLAEVIRLYGTGPLTPAAEHYTAHKDLF
ncbi:helix-turn-helix domain-containing protein [Nesterenkonia flava]|uniref:DNA-binding protein n=1 Tax=Nesterenkonia flava TaxID=469799 RepID=A0ABU1FQ04_9MICC|nr:DNA-binding protein [Nesterenkonia flava]MDR5710727.1 DNA-binding protein [Nesterenkonia flava]